MGKICSGFGNSNWCYDIMPKIMTALEYAIDEGCDTFFLGERGLFDSYMLEATRELQAKYPHIKRVLVIPYITKTLENYKRDYERDFDSILLPHEMLLVPPRFAILKRNEWVIDQSDIVLFYTRYTYGGSGKAADYARRKKKFTIHLEKDDPFSAF
ncbi:MAG: hypothetical protein IJS17_03310 [Clostridia bacterium]|nr:hypothetical protein [Clostridia bacterium]